MTEQDRAPLIRLPIDQEVYMDTVQEGTVVEDATVATEVVSFERVGDAYVLEGAIVFAGYISKEVANDMDEAVAEDGKVEHFHQRLPFILRVPIQTQPRGILNVKSRLSGWQLSVAGRGWLRVEGDLQVAGLSGDDGYHFECGGQQLGHPLFDMATRSLEVDKEVDFSEDSRGEPPISSGEPEVQEEPPMFRNHVAKDELEEVIEKMSEARGGHGLDDIHVETKVDKTPLPMEATDVAQIRAVDDLANFDRFFTNNVAKEVQTDQGTSQVQPPLAEFEFEHQLSPDEMANLEEKAPPAKGQNEAFIASRSFTNDGFQAAAGFSHRYTEDVSELKVQKLVELTDEQIDEHSELDLFEQKTDRFEDESQEKLWSFVDFNGPENKYTLRYVIVMEEETLETIAEKIHCTKSELMRANHLEIESIAPGQTLLIPDAPYTFAK